MAVRAIGEYTFPSRSRQELYGDDQLVHVWWKGDLWFAATACFRAPKAMSWNDFLANVEGARRAGWETIHVIDVAAALEELDRILAGSPPGSD